MNEKIVIDADIEEIDFTNGGMIDFEGETILAFFMNSEWSIPVFFLMILVLKVFSMSFTNAGGGVGGTFGPTLFIGAIAGFVADKQITTNRSIPNTCKQTHKGERDTNQALYPCLHISHSPFSFNSTIE